MNIGAIFRRALMRSATVVPPAAPPGLSRAYVNDALAEMDRIYKAKGAQAACLFIRVALIECPIATASEVERAVAGFREACTHDWVSTTNKFIPSGQMCSRCGSPRAVESGVGGPR